MVFITPLLLWFLSYFVFWPSVLLQVFSWDFRKKLRLLLNYPLFQYLLPALPGKGFPIVLNNIVLLRVSVLDTKLFTDFVLVYCFYYTISFQHFTSIIFLHIMLFCAYVFDYVMYSPPTMQHYNSGEFSSWFNYTFSCLIALLCTQSGCIPVFCDSS